MAAGDVLSLLDARDLASQLSLRAVEEQLDYDFLDEHAEAASRFFELWLPTLRPFEQMQAADWASTQYVLAMVHIEHSYGLGARVMLEGFTTATAELAEALVGFRDLTRGPDAEVGEEVGTRLVELAATVSGIHAELAGILEQLPESIPRRQS